MFLSGGVEKEMKKKKYPIYDFIAAMAFVFDVDWDSEYLPEEPDEIGLSFLKSRPNSTPAARQVEILDVRDAG